jgi:hypothetical protein
LHVFIMLNSAALSHSSLECTNYSWLLRSRPSASSAVMRLDGKNRINPWVTCSRDLSVGLCTVSANFRSSFDISQSLSGFNKRFYGVLIGLPFSIAKSWLDLIFIDFHWDSRSVGNFSTKPIICKIKTSSSPRYQNGYVVNKKE